MNVIDGQQRLTTLQVLLTACRAAARASGAGNSEQLIKMLLNNTEQLIPAAHPEERYKVWPSMPDRERSGRCMSSRSRRPRRESISWSRHAATSTPK